MDTSLKRPRDDYDEGSGYQNDADDAAKRMRPDPVAELVTNICKDIRRIGEVPNLASQVDDIVYISNPIVVEFEKIDALRDAVLRTLYAVVVEQPQKIPNVGVLIFICNAKNFLVAKYVVEYFHGKAQALLDLLRGRDTEMEDSEQAAATPASDDAGVFNNLKSIFKFLAVLSPLIENNAVGGILKQFMAVAVELQTACSARSGTAEAIYYNVLMATPYLFAGEFSPAAVAVANEIVELALLFPIVDADRSLAVLEPFDSKNSNFSDALPYKPQKIVNLVLPAVAGLQGPEKDWAPLKGLLFLDFAEFVDPVTAQALQDNSISSEIVKHTLPSLALPSIDELKAYKPTGLIDTLWYEHPRLLFQVYNTTTTAFETVPPIETYFGLFFKDLAFDILTNMSFNQKEASLQLSILDLFCCRDLFSPPGSSVDQLALIAKDNEAGENQPPLLTWKVEDVAVESILTMIFQLPHSLHREIYYYTVLISCCRESPESIAPVFGRAIRFLYNNLETLDYEAKIRFMDWMTTQISNFDFSWKWDEWAPDSAKYTNLTYHPKKNFIKNLIAKEIRLSNKSRIKDSFVTMSQTPDGETQVVALEEFHKYLDISLFPNATQYIIDYDYELYGGDNEDIKTILLNSITQKFEALLQKQMVSAQEELVYEFSNTQLPLNEISNKLYDFIIANWRSNEQFNDMVNETVEAIKSSVVNIDTERLLVNLLFQTYAYIGSRSIYSVVSIVNRDIAKLKFVSGLEVTEEDYKLSGNEFKFPDLGLTPEQVTARQTWVIDSVMRIWIHQPQVAFLILEYLIEFGILQPQHLIRSALRLEHSLIINNVSCMESMNRVLSSCAKSDNSKDVLLLLFGHIVENLNAISSRLGVEADSEVAITKDFTEEQKDDAELMKQIDLQWLFFEYRGLLKTYIRQFHQELQGFKEDVVACVEAIENNPVKKDALQWVEELDF